MADKNTNQILACALDAQNQLKMEMRACVNAGRDIYRLEYIGEQLENIINDCNMSIESSLIDGKGGN